MNDNEIFKKAIEKWGVESQSEMIIEECAEVIMAFQKLKRAYYSMNNEVIQKTTNNVCEELADLSIMLDQMKLIFDNSKIEKIRIEKISRLKERIEK